MSSAVVSGAIGAAIATAIMAFALTRTRVPRADGDLRYGWGIALLGAACGLLAVLPVGLVIADPASLNDTGNQLALAGLFIGFGTGSVYSFGEYLRVHGKVDEERIQFHSPWTGPKDERWSELREARFNPQLNWYVLTFNNGTKIRISNMLSGHGAVLDQLRKHGFNFD